MLFLLTSVVLLSPSCWWSWPSSSVTYRPPSLTWTRPSLLTRWVLRGSSLMTSQSCGMEDSSWGIIMWSSLARRSIDSLVWPKYHEIWVVHTQMYAIKRLFYLALQLVYCHERHRNGLALWVLSLTDISNFCLYVFSSVNLLFVILPSSGYRQHCWAFLRCKGTSILKAYP